MDSTGGTFARATPEVNEMFGRLGYALWLVQMLEDGVAAYLVVVHQLEPNAALEQAEAAMTAASTRTLGQLLKKIRGHETPTDVAERLEKFVDDRNWLVHHIYREYYGTIRDPEVSATINARLDTIGREALELTKLFTEELRAYVISTGKSAEMLDSLERQIHDEVRAGKSTPDRRGFRLPKGFTLPPGERET